MLFYVKNVYFLKIQSLKLIMFTKKMKIEKIICLTFILSLIFKLLHWPGGSVLMILSVLFLVLLYFPLGFYIFNEDKKRLKENIGISFIFGWFLSISLVGILFKLMLWPGSKSMLIIGFASSLILFIVASMLKNKRNETDKVYFKNLLIRTGTIFVITLLLLLVSNQSLIRFQYHDDPKYAELMIEKNENPNSIEIDKKIEDYLIEKNRKNQNE